jgi:inner membrane protein
MLACVASLLTHAVAAVALGQAARPAWRSDWRFWAVAILCSMLPDIDVVGFPLGIRYGDLWGHRGLTHSFLFAAVLGLVVAFFYAPSLRDRIKFAFVLFVVTASHGLLDALTNGGLGVAFFSPLDARRYFFPWRPLQVSPLSVRGFLTDRGLAILWNEALWIWIPALCGGGFLYWLAQSRNAQRK